MPSGCGNDPGDGCSKMTSANCNERRALPWQQAHSCPDSRIRLTLTPCCAALRCDDAVPCSLVLVVMTAESWGLLIGGVFMDAKTAQVR